MPSALRFTSQHMVAGLRSAEMPRYHFNTANGHCFHDNDGCEFDSLEQARIEAVRLAGALLGETPDMLWKSGNFRVEVADDDGTVLFTFVGVPLDGSIAKSESGAADRPH